MTTDTISIEEFTKNRPTLTFGSFIRSMREIQEIPQIKMAKMMGISKSMLCDIEKGRQLVSPTLAAKFAQKAKIPVKASLQLALQDQLRKAKLKYTVSVA